MQKLQYILIICLTMVSFSCKRLLDPFTTEDSVVVVASVGERQLLSTDIDHIFADNISHEDSLTILESYVNMWVRIQLKLERAELIFSENQKDIDKMVDEYRNSLLNYKLDQHYIDKNIDVSVTESDIVEYYNKNAKEFRLDNIIVKGRVVKIPETYRQYVKLQTLMKSSNSEKQQDFIDICDKNDFQLAIFDEWVDFNELLGFLPTRKGDSYTRLLNTTEVQFMADQSNKYLFNIYESKNKGETAPIELTKDKIRKIILNQRRVDILKVYEDSLYIKAKQNNRIIVNIDKNRAETALIDSIIVE